MPVAKQRVLVIDDDEPMRDLIRAYLDDTYEVVDTGDPENALRMTLEHKPNAILLDLGMPGFTGFELCKTLSSLGFMHQIPILIVSGADARNKAFCESLGASVYLHKPIDAEQLRDALAQVLAGKVADRRGAPRTNSRIAMKLKWNDKSGTPMEVQTVTENVSATGFLCGSKRNIEIGTQVEVFVGDDGEHYMGTAKVVRLERSGTGVPFYGCHFIIKAE